jgi:hypothetical protein
MLAVVLTLILQSTSIKGSVEPPIGMSPPSTARVVLLPLEYAKIFNAETQIRIDNYWELFKRTGLAKTDREQFIQYMPIAYGSSLENTVAQMRRDSKINLSALIRTAPQGKFEFNNISPGEYKLVATASLSGVDYVWTETIQVQSTPLLVQMKTRVP